MHIKPLFFVESPIFQIIGLHTIQLPSHVRKVMMPMMIAFHKMPTIQYFSCNSRHHFSLLSSSSNRGATFLTLPADFKQDQLYNTTICLHIILISAMFWQGGGKKRLKHQIENIMEVPQHQVDKNAIGKNDDELLHIYYYRDGYFDAEDYEEATPRPHKFREPTDNSPIIERSNPFSGLTFPSSNSRLPKSHIE